MDEEEGDIVFRIWYLVSRMAMSYEIRNTKYQILNAIGFQRLKRYYFL